MAKECNEKEHQGHICVLVSKGLFEQITRDPKDICFNNPMPLE